MSILRKKLLDVLLYPARLYEQLSGRRVALFAGVVLVGVIDLLLHDATPIYEQFFADRSTRDIYVNAILAGLIIMVLGFVDVTFVCIPLFDFFRHIKKKEVGFKGNGY